MFEANQLNVADGMGVCDSNDSCEWGSFNAETGNGTLHDTNLLPSASDLEPQAAVQSFARKENGSALHDDRTAYTCPAVGVAQCCNGMGCADMVPPYAG